VARSIRIVAAVLLLAALAAGGWWWQQQRQVRPPDGIAYGNGRLEAEQVDIATKFPGRIVDILVGEGDMVVAGQVVARMDTAEIEAQIRQAEAETRRQRQAVAEADFTVAQRRSELDLVRRNLHRTLTLAAQGHVAQQRVDQERSQERTAAASDRLREQLAEATLRAPRAGRVQYRLAQLGEVLPGGGKVLTLLDIADVYMTIFLPTAEARRLAIGADARIVLDAVPDTPLPSRVSFVAAQAQFTPARWRRARSARS
jgi:HlyD family secretion protein